MSRKLNNSSETNLSSEENTLFTDLTAEESVAVNGGLFFGGVFVPRGPEKITSDWFRQLFDDKKWLRDILLPPFPPFPGPRVPFPFR